MATRKPAAKGMPPPPHLTYYWHFANEQERAAAIREYIEDEYCRMVALADSLGIPNNLNRWYTLALHLAREHVPELGEAKRIGSPKKWGNFELGVLAVEIERALQRGERTIGSAAAVLAKREPWKSFLQVKGGTYLGPDPVAALVKQYSIAGKAPFTSIVRKAFKYHEATDTVAEWDEWVLGIGQR